MIIVKLMGGLGNQMFQYAFAKNISLKYQEDLKIDLSFLKNRNMGPNFVYRDYDLDIFNIKADFQLNFSKKIYKLVEPHFQFSKECYDSFSQVKNLDGHLYIDGYWQSPFYFLENEHLIKDEFSFLDKIENSNDVKISNLVEKIKSTNSVMINVRRTDYLTTDFHGVMGNEFIKNSIDLISQKSDDLNFFCFSDDIEWCRNNIKIENVTFVDHYFKGDRFSYYLQLMSLCKHFVVPNSTFAWWSAYLSESENKIVVCPKKWFSDDKIDTSDLIPKNWFRI